MSNSPNIVLGIESSCDETAAAVVSDGKNVHSSVVASQDALHEKYGGVIPEIASRAHVEAMVPVAQEAVERSGFTKEDIEAAAVAHRPGLAGSLLIGLTFAKSFSLAMDIPLVGIDHLHAHLYASMLEHEITFPAVGLVVSGGHTALFLWKDILDITLIGSTIDDAAGEAFDKASSILGLGYPGGPYIERAAQQGDKARFDFPRTFIRDDTLKFSFSGIKTAVLYHCQGHSQGKGEIRDMDGQEINDIAASFQEAVTDVLAAKVQKAVHETGARSVAAGGGVVCNTRLREKISETCGVDVYFPSPVYCIDNAAMIAGLGCHLLQAGVKHDLFLDVDSEPVRMKPDKRIF